MTQAKTLIAQTEDICTDKCTLYLVSPQENSLAGNVMTIEAVFIYHISWAW